MRIALLSYEYPPETGFGGIGTYTWYQARALVRLGHDVHVVAGATEPGIRHDSHDGVQVTRVAGPGPLEAAAEGLTARGLHWAANRIRTAEAAHHGLRRILADETFDVVEYPECGADGLLVSTLLPVRTSVRLHSPARLIMGSYGADPADVEATTMLEQVAINRADVRLAPSRFVADEAMTVMDVPAPVHVVPNGIDLDLFDRDHDLGAARRFGLPDDAILVFSSGRLEARKGVHLLADVWLPILLAHPEVHVVVAGADVDGVLEGQIRPRLAAHGVDDRLHHLGRVSLGEVRSLLRRVDVHLHPTTWDNAPYSCIEAMAAGLAVVASDCGGLPEMVTDGHDGLLAASGDPAAFADRLRRVIVDPELRTALGRAARRTVEERFTDVQMARRSVEVWRTALP